MMNINVDDQVLMMKKGCEITKEEEEEEITAGDDHEGELDDDDDNGRERLIRTARKYYHGELHYYGNKNTTSNLYTDTTGTNDKKSSSEEILEVEDEDEDEGCYQRNSSSYQEVEEEEEEEKDKFYVAISSSTSSSMHALLWTLHYAVVDSSSTTVFLVHVFPEIKHIPTPLGRVPVSQVNPEQKEKHMVEERRKRREYLNEFLNACSSISKVKVDIILIESDMEAQAILDLIPILSITKLVLGITKANLRKMRSERGNGLVVGEIVKAAPEFCEVLVVCEGKEVLHLFTDPPSREFICTPPPQSSEAHSTSPSFGCGGCFNFKFLS